MIFIKKIAISKEARLIQKWFSIKFSSSSWNWFFFRSSNEIDRKKFDVFDCVNKIAFPFSSRGKKSGKKLGKNLHICSEFRNKQHLMNQRKKLHYLSISTDQIQYSFSGNFSIMFVVFLFFHFHDLAPNKTTPQLHRNKNIVKKRICFIE